MGIGRAEVRLKRMKLNLPSVGYRLGERLSKNMGVWVGVRQ